jgi:hypothetical protein
MPNIFVKRGDLFFVSFIPFGRFGNWGLNVGYIGIYWVDGVKGFKKEAVTLSNVPRRTAIY